MPPPGHEIYVRPRVTLTFCIRLVVIQRVVSGARFG